MAAGRLFLAAAGWRPWRRADPRAAGAGDRWRQRGGEDGGVAGRAGAGDQQTWDLAFPEKKALSGQFQSLNPF